MFNLGTLRRFIFSTNHKDIGILYFIFAVLTRSNEFMVLFSIKSNSQNTNPQNIMQRKDIFGKEENKQAWESLKDKSLLKNYGFIETVGAGIAQVKGLFNVKAGELVRIYGFNLLRLVFLRTYLSVPVSLRTNMLEWISRFYRLTRYRMLAPKKKGV